VRAFKLAAALEVAFTAEGSKGDNSCKRIGKWIYLAKSRVVHRLYAILDPCPTFTSLNAPLDSANNVYRPVSLPILFSSSAENESSHPKA
jgi:hypothetical protein